MTFFTTLLSISLRLVSTLILLSFFSQPILASPLGTSNSLQVLRVGSYDNPPKVYQNGDGDFSGIFPDVLSVIASQEGWILEYIHGTWQECMDRLEAGQIDIMVDIAYSRQREERFQFSGESVFLNWGTLYSRQGLYIESISDLQGKRIASVREDIHTVGENGIIRLTEKFDLDVDILETDSYAQVLQMVDSGEVDVGVVNRLYGAVNKKSYNINTSPVIFNPVQLKFAFTKTPALQPVMEAIDRHLNRLKHDSTSVFHKIVNSYLAGIEYDMSAYYDIRPIRLNEEELAWLREHQTIRIGVDKDYAPYSALNNQGKYEGLAVDMLRLVSQHLDMEVEIVPDLSWQEILEEAKEQRLDAILTAVKTPQRQKFLSFTKIYLPTPLVIMTRQENYTLEGPEDLEGQRVALVQDYAVSRQLVKAIPSVHTLMVDTPIQGLTAVAVGEAEYYVGTLGVNDYQIRKNGISNLKVAARYDMQFNGQRIAVRKDWPILVAILDKALDALSEKKKMELYQAWISANACLEGPAALQEENALNAEETAWVQAHKNIRIGIDPEFAPFEFFDKQGNVQGTTSEYITLLNRRLGLNMQVVPELSWEQVMDKARTKDVDVLPCVGKTQARQEFLAYTKPYMSYNRVIITRTDSPFIASIDNIEDLRVAVQAGTSHSGFLNEQTTIRPEIYPTLVATLRAVSEGKADALVGNLASSIYWIRKEHLTNLKIAGPVTYASDHLHFAVRNDWPELIPILEKGLASISPAKEKLIQEKWIKIDYDPGINPKVLITYIAEALGVLSIIFLLVLAWNYRLKREISRRLQSEKELQHQLFHAQKMKAIGTLSGGIAHDFNNILTAIMGYIQLAELSIDNPKKLQQMLSGLTSAANRAQSLVQQILTFSRQSKQQKSLLNVDGIANEVVELLQQTVPKSIDIHLVQQSTSRIHADSDQIHQVLMNLCTNAYQAMKEEQGILSIDVRDEQFSQAHLLGEVRIPPGNYVTIMVSDTGAGMEDEIRSKIFDPFFTTKSIGEGTGLGLSVVHGIVSDHGGFIHVASEPGQGTTFTLFFPVQEGKDLTNDLNEQTGAVDAASEQKNLRVLFVDDEQAIGEVARLAFTARGYQVDVFQDPQEAVQYFRPHAYDFLITDLTMPKMSGLDLIRILKEQDPDLRAYLCSGQGHRSADDLESLDIENFIAKPFTMQQMIALIQQVDNTEKAG